MSGSERMDDRIAFDAVAAALRGICRDPLPDLTPQTHLDELPGMDSLRVLHVIAMMEEQFGVEIDVAALDGLHQVRDVLQAVRAAAEGTPCGRTPPPRPSSPIKGEGEESR